MLAIRVLGELSVLRDGKPVALPPSRKTRALLGYLVATRRPQRRERLCTLFWEVPDDPRGALRWSLSKLRALVDEPDGAPCIRADRDTVAFAPEGVACDAWALRELVARPLDAAPTDHLQTVADGIGGDFLEGLDLPAQPDFQAWLLAEREDTRRRHAAILGALVRRLSVDSPEAALPHARRQVELNAFDAQARAALIRLLTRVGRQEEAEQHGETGLRLLHEAGLPAGDLAAALREARALPGRAALLRQPAEADVALDLQLGASPDRTLPAGQQDEAREIERVIVVDDDSEFGGMVADYLVQHGFAVRTATSGRALDVLLKAEPADLLLLDVNLPGEDGFAIARRLRARGENTRFLFVTAVSETTDRVVGLELGAEDYVAKPFDLRELLARIRAVLRRAEPPMDSGRAVQKAGAPPRPAEPSRDERQPPVLLPHQDIRFCVAQDGVRIAYATVGQGSPLLKLANWMTHLEHDWESPVWRHWIRELSSDRRLIRYDERGNGLSDWDVEDLSFEACLRDLEAVVEASGLERFPMLGISQGCAFAVAYAVRHPERVSRLVLYGGYVRGWAMRGSPAEIARRQGLGALIRHGWGEDNPAFRQAFTTLFVPDATPEQMRWFNDLQCAAASPENAFRLHEVFGQLNIRALLPHVRVPTLVLHGRHDGVVPFEEGRILATEIPGARFVPLESRNHILLENEPAWERFLVETRDFLDTNAL